jgi:hypothetical protein
MKIGAERLGYGDMPGDVTTAEWSGVQSHAFGVLSSQMPNRTDGLSLQFRL